MDKVNNIPTKDKGKINYYNKRLEIDPDTAIEKTREKFGYNSYQTVYNLANKYSQTPSDYKKSIQDNKALGSLVADNIVDEKLNKEYDEILTSDMILLIKSLKALGVDVKSLVAEILQYLYHNKIMELTSDTLISIEHNIPLRKTLKRQVEEKKAEAAIMKHDVEIKKLKTGMIDEEISQYIVKDGAIRIMGNGQSDDNDEIKNIIYDEEYEEMYNEAMNIKLEASIPNYPAAIIEFKKLQFKLKWGFRIEKTVEIGQLKAEKEARIRDKKRKEAELELDNTEQELEEYLNSLPIEDLVKINKGGYDI